MAGEHGSPAKPGKNKIDERFFLKNTSEGKKPPHLMSYKRVLNSCMDCNRTV